MFVLRSTYDKDKSEIENKNPDTSGLVKKTDYNVKITEIERQIPDVCSLATKTALTVKENKTLNVKKTDYDRKITEIEKKLTSHNHDNYITTPEFNTFAASVFNARLARVNLVTKTDFDHKLSYLDSTIAANKTKNEFIENEKSYFIGKSHFEEDDTQNYLVFQPLNKYIKMTANTDYISSWKFKGLSAETITPSATSDNSLTSALSYYGAKTAVKFTGSCLKEPKI